MFRLCKMNCMILKGQKFFIPSINRISLALPRSIVSSSVLYNKESQEEGLMIYKGQLRSQIRAVKVFSLTSSLAGLVAQPILINESARIGSTGLLVAMCSVVGFFTFITPLLLHIITKKYVLEMEYFPKTETFAATTITFFCREKRHLFKAEDVEVPDIPGMFTTFHAKGFPLFVEARNFGDVTYYAKIMGYDKPMDYKLGNQEEVETKQNN